MFYFIRHAQSFFNIQDKKRKNEYKNDLVKKQEQYIRIKFDPQFADCGLTQKGKQQCQNAKKQVQQIDVDLVLVSPMRRTLETCHILFKDHPKKPKILVDPSVRQIFKCSCDIGSRLRQSMQDFPYFDYSQIKNIQYWYIDSIKNEKIREQLLSKLNNKLYQHQVQGQQKTIQNQIVNKYAFQIMLNYLKQSHNIINQYTLSNFQAQKQRMRDLNKQFQRIAIVSHHDNIVAYTKIPSANCQILKIPVDKL